MQLDRNLLLLLHAVCRDLDGDVTLRALARRARYSRFHLHRLMTRLLGETPKRYTSRLRLERAAARLAVDDEPVVSIALTAGFASHEVFTRAFKRRFGCTPTQYRASARESASPAERARHAQVSNRTAPCIGLFRLSLETTKRRFRMPDSSIERRDLTAQPVLFIRRRVARESIAQAIGECLGKIAMHCQQSGAAFAGPPFARYPSAGPGLVTVEIGMPVASAAAGTDEIEAGALQSGPAAFAVHAGPYDRLGETYAALERWMEARGARPNGAPWESYVTDPAEFPNPEDWRTEVYWPMSE